MKKILMLTTVALLSTTGLVAAQDTTASADAFAQIPVQNDNQLIQLPLVTATADGLVEIRGIAGEQEGEVFGSQPVTAGANENVKVTLLQGVNANAVMAVLVVDGVDVAMQEVRLSPPGSNSDGDDSGDGSDNSDDADDSDAGGDDNSSGG